jgi:hypothetical protein
MGTIVNARLAPPLPAGCFAAFAVLGPVVVTPSMGFRRENQRATVQLL